MGVTEILERYQKTKKKRQNEKSPKTPGPLEKAIIDFCNNKASTSRFELYELLLNNQHKSHPDEIIYLLEPLIRHIASILFTPATINQLDCNKKKLPDINQSFFFDTLRTLHEHNLFSSTHYKMLLHQLLLANKNVTTGNCLEIHQCILAMQKWKMLNEKNLRELLSHCNKSLLWVCFQTILSANKLLKEEILSNIFELDETQLIHLNRLLATSAMYLADQHVFLDYLINHSMLLKEQPIIEQTPMHYATITALYEKFKQSPERYLHSEFTNQLMRLCKSKNGQITEDDLIQFSLLLTPDNLHKTKFTQSGTDFQTLCTKLQHQIVNSLFPATASMQHIHPSLYFQILWVLKNTKLVSTDLINRVNLAIKNTPKHTDLVLYTVTYLHQFKLLTEPNLNLLFPSDFNPSTFFIQKIMFRADIVVSELRFNQSMYDLICSISPNNIQFFSDLLEEAEPISWSNDRFIWLVKFCKNEFLNSGIEQTALNFRAFICLADNKLLSLDNIRALLDNEKGELIQNLVVNIPFITTNFKSLEQKMLTIICAITLEKLKEVNELIELAGPNYWTIDELSNLLTIAKNGHSLDEVKKRLENPPVEPVNIWQKFCTFFVSKPTDSSDTTQLKFE